MYAAHIISTPEGCSFVGVGPADEARIRVALTDSSDWEVWVGPARERRYSAVADHLGIRLALYAETDETDNGGWMRVSGPRAAAIANAAMPLGEMPEDETPAILRTAAKLFNMSQETLAHLIGASPAKVCRMQAGNGSLSHTEYSRLAWWAENTGIGELFADCIRSLKADEPLAPRPAMLTIVGEDKT